MKKLLFSLSLCLVGTASLHAQDFYDRSAIQTIEVFFGFSNWDAQLDQLASTTEDYLLADSVRINGVTFDSVGVKYKGNSSYNANNNKNPLHIELDYTHGSYDYQGYTDIKLQNGYQDPSMIREVLSYAILEQYMDCPKANFANVYINGSLRGLYSNAESINDKFNGDHYYTSDGSFFKCNPIGGAGPGGGGNPDLNWIDADSSSYANGYELKSDYGWNDLVALIDTLNNHFTEIDANLDVDRAIWMLAFNNVLVNLDSYSGAFRQNYYLYKDLNDRFVPTVWDLNMSFAGFPGGPSQGQSYTATTLDPMSNSASANHPLIVKLLGDPMYKRMYMAHIRTIVEENFASTAYLTTANALRSTIDAAVQADPYKFYTYTQYQNSLTTAVSGGGPGGSSIPGIQALMSARNTFFQSNANYTYVAPTITNVQPSTASPAYGSTVTITATCSGETSVYLGTRPEHPLRFTRVQMYDDGAHGDGGAGDHVYGASVVLNSVTLEYYVYAENAQAGIFSPQRAEHEYYTLNVTLALPNVGDVLINEIMADNGSTAYDSNGENDDWVELYNTTANGIDLTGLYLSDDETDLEKWLIPTGTSINAHDVLVIWTDEDSEQSGLHTNFKLSAAGETLYLSNGNGGTVYDMVEFGVQTEDVSYARCPDGGMFQFEDPTFDALNNCVLSISENALPLAVRLYPVPTAGNLFLQSQEEGMLSIMIVDLQGRLVYSGTSDQETTEIPSSEWQAGWYEVRVVSAEGKMTMVPFVKQ